MTDLLSSSMTSDRGARFVEGAIEVIKPWGLIEHPPTRLAKGWYALKVDGSGPLCVRLCEKELCGLIELTAQTDQPAYIRLKAGTYQAQLIAGGRPGVYPFAAAELVRLSFFEYTALLGSRFWQAIRQGLPPRRIAGLVRLALNRNVNFGLRAQALTLLQDIGPLARQDRAVQSHSPIPRNAQARLAALASGPKFYIPSANSGVPLLGLEAQIYRNFSAEPDGCDYHLVTGTDDALTPDALLLFAEAVRDTPEVKIVLADIWIGDRPTARVAWDPLLYAEGPPTPYILATDTSLESVAELDQRHWAIISVPVCSRPAASTPPIDAPGRPAPPPSPLCSIIIPTRDRSDLLDACLTSLFDITTGLYEVIVVDNGSVEAETFAVLERFRPHGLRVLRADMPFNFSALCNLGAQSAQGNYVLFLNNDVVLFQPDWLQQMMQYAVRPEVGAVGAKLLYADGRLQHGGVALGLTEACGHLWRGLAPEAAQAEDRLQRDSLRAAVTAACMCVEKAKFDAVGGFDEIWFPVTLNDIDLCLKLLDRGWSNVFCAGAEAYHLEGESRGEDACLAKRQRRENELRAFGQKWHAYLKSDLWLSLATSRTGEHGGAI